MQAQKPLLTEPATGIAFPGNFCTTKATACPALAGMGVRAKRLLGIKNINVYAVRCAFELVHCALLCSCSYVVMMEAWFGVGVRAKH